MNDFEYDRAAAVSYAHKWAMLRNPEYYDYEKIGGDCTNFVSQCLYAGSGVMDYSMYTGWYYRNANDKAPAWTGVDFLWRYLIRDESGEGPFGIITNEGGVSPGDIVQLSFDGKSFSHSQIVVETGKNGILIAAHSYDCDYRKLDTYIYEEARFLHIAGVKKQ